MSSVLQEGLEYLKERNVPEAEASSEFLLSHVLKIGRAQILGNGIAPISLDEKKRFLALIRRRAAREPLAYVIGVQPFVDLEILCGPGVLVPRPETEELLVEIFKKFRGREKDELSFLDIGSGTGAIAISLARHFKNSRVFAMENSAGARNWMRKNLGLYPQEAKKISLLPQDMSRDWKLKGQKFDLIISNPPYIPSSEIKKLEIEVLKEPRAALDGGRNGLKYLRRIISCAPRHLKPQGLLAVEIGFNQGAGVKKIMRSRGFKQVEIKKDFAGIERFALARKD